ncbi:MAG: hypothetical protein KKA73_21550 [Chloroflexi bacterium]|nr:hypothetical protein [Chloroflexota bacterium]MBU1750280.1 hypothetical protein [Chloroflexota bacterium]
MTGLAILVGALAVALGLAAGLLAWLLLDLGLDGARWAQARLRQGRRPFWLVTQAAEPSTVATPAPASRFQRWLRVMPLLAGMAGALYIGAAAPLIGGSLLLAGLVLFWYLGPRARRQGTTTISDQVFPLVEEVRSLYAVTAMPMTCLEGAVAATPEPLRGLVQQAVDQFQMNLDLGAALDALVAAGQYNAYLAYLAYILGQSTRTGPDAVGAALLSLEDRLRDREKLRQRASVVLRMTSITLRTLQGALVAGLAGALLVPLFADFFTSSLGRQVIYCLVLWGVLAASLYLDRETQHLQGGVV